MDGIKKKQSKHGIHKRGNCTICKNFNNQRSDKIKIHVTKAHPEKYEELYGAPDGAPNGAPIGAPIGAPNGAPVGAPNGAPALPNDYIHKDNCNCFVPGLLVDASTQTRIRMDNLKKIILIEKSKTERRV